MTNPPQGSDAQDHDDVGRDGVGRDGERTDAGDSRPGPERFATQPAPPAEPPAPGETPTPAYGQPTATFGTPSYGPPARSYGQPTPQYGQPAQPYAPLGQPYGEAPEAPAPGTGTPYGQPPAGPYGPPAPQYRQPAPQYGGSQYGTPPYGAPGLPPGAPAEKSKVGLIAAVTGITLLLIAGVVVLVMSLQSTVLDPAAVERDVAAQFEQREGVAIELDCAENMKVNAHATYQCSGTTADGESVTLQITIADENTAAYTWTEP